jgi:hypothetical protein
MHIYTPIPSLTHAADRIETRAIQRRTIEAYRPAVAAVARQTVPWSQHWELAERVGCIGVLVALQRTLTDVDFARELEGHDLRLSPVFRRAAFASAQREIEEWIDRATFRRPIAPRQRQQLALVEHAKVMS